MTIELEPGMRILFQGDSITDCGRREPAYQPMGRGYASMVIWWLSARYPERELEFINRGVSGNRTRDLLDRWDNDCISLKPQLLSILVGINDTWRRYDSKDATEVDTFEKSYERLLKSVKEACDPQLVICEPFLLAHPPGIEVMRDDLDPKIYVVRELARKYKAIYVPFDGVFAAASTRVHPSYWAEDGVHPTHAGHALMARTWMECVLGGIP